MLAPTLDTALRMFFTRMDPYTFRPAWLARLATMVGVGTNYKEERHPVSRVMFALYEPACRWVLHWPKTTIALALHLGKRLQDPVLDLEQARGFGDRDAGQRRRHVEERAFVERRHELVAELEIDRHSREHHDQRMHGKAGRAETSTDPAPFSMMETVVLLKDPSQWRPKARFYSDWAPEWLKETVLRRIVPERLTRDELIAELDRATSPTPGRC